MASVSTFVRGNSPLPPRRKDPRMARSIGQPASYSLDATSTPSALPVPAAPAGAPPGRAPCLGHPPLADFAYDPARGRFDHGISIDPEFRRLALPLSRAEKNRLHTELQAFGYAYAPL